MLWIIWIVLFALSIYSHFVCLHIVEMLVSRRNGDASIVTPTNTKTIRTMIVMGSGGHTGEMLYLLSHMDFNLFSQRLYVIANTDHMSGGKVRELERSLDSIPDNFQIGTISRSREVGQSWITTIFSSLASIFQSYKILMLNKPDLIICNGPGTCVPLCLAAFMLQALWIKNIVVVFNESLCRVNTLSVTGKLMAHCLADRSIVQWPELHAKYPQTVYLGKV